MLDPVGTECSGVCSWGLHGLLCLILIPWNDFFFYQFEHLILELENYIMENMEDLM